jgi:hypothetical protein
VTAVTDFNFELFYFYIMEGTKMTTQEIRNESLQRAVSGQSVMNYVSIYEGFSAMGIPMDEIKPRENVFTFNAWIAAGRHVRKGQHGVKAVTFVPVADKREEPTADVPNGKQTAGYRMPRTVTVFHISQTEVTA